MKKRFVLTASIAATAAAIADARPSFVAYRCNHCTEAEYLNMATGLARQYGMGPATEPYVHIYDLTRRNLRKYAVARDAGAEHPAYDLTEVTPTISENERWQRACDALEANHGRSSFLGVVDAKDDVHLPDRAADAYQFAQTTAYQNDVGTWLTTAADSPMLVAGSGLTTAALFELASSIVLDSDAFSFTVRVATMDRGKIDFHWAAGDARATMAGAYDADNNSIPLVVSQLPTAYRLSMPTTGLFMDYLSEHFGRQVSIEAPDTCMDGMFACTADKDGYSYSCRWTRCGDLP